MEKDFWLQAWIDGKTAFHQPEYNATLVGITKEMDLKSKCVFIPLAGKTNDILYFLERGASVFAVELSEKACQEFFIENGINHTFEEHKTYKVFKAPNLTFYQGDFFSLSKEEIPKIDFLYDRASLVALPPSMRKDYYKKINQLIKKDTKILLLTYSHETDNKDFGPPFHVPIQEIKESYLNGLQLECEVEGHMKMDKDSRLGQAGIHTLKRLKWTHNI